MVKVVYPYSCDPDCGNRRFVTKSEQEFFNEWKASIRRAAVGKMQGWIDEEYKQSTREMETAPNTGNSTTDGVIGFARFATNLGGEFSRMGGWGANS